MKRREFLQSVAAVCGLAVVPVGAAVIATRPRLTAPDPVKAAMLRHMKERQRDYLLARQQRDWDRIDATLMAYVPDDEPESIVIPFSEQAFWRARA